MFLRLVLSQRKLSWLSREVHNPWEGIALTKLLP